MRSRLAIPGHSFLRPLIHGFDRAESPFDMAVDLPAKHALNFSERTGGLRWAFLSPIDYARHGADYCIVPGIAVSSAEPNGVVRLHIRPDVRNIRSIAVDIRVTSEILLAKIILVEKFRNLPTAGSDLTFIPMLPDPAAMLQKADAALIVSFGPEESTSESSFNGAFTLDLVEEWYDLTGLPYVFGFWVGREEELDAREANAIVAASRTGLAARDRIVHDFALQVSLPGESVQRYFDSFSYDLREQQEDSIREFFHYAFFHRALPDIPELQYFDLGNNPASDN